MKANTKANTTKPNLNQFGKIDNSYTFDDAIIEGTVHTRELAENKDFFLQWAKIDFSPILGQTFYSRKKLSGAGINDKMVFYEIKVDSTIELPHAISQQVNIIRRRIDGDKAHTFEQGEIIQVKLSQLFPMFEGRTPSAGVKKTEADTFIAFAKKQDWSTEQTSQYFDLILTGNISDSNREQIEEYKLTLTLTQ